MIYIFVFILTIIINTTSGDIDFALECNPGYRISGIRRAKTHYSILGSLSIECEQIARPETTTCSNQQSIPKCTGQLEGCFGNNWLGGYHAFLLENNTQAVILDPICCTSPSVRIDSNSCIHDQLNTATKDFKHSVVSDLLYRGVQCWHQYDTNHTLVDLLWKTEICPFQSNDFPVVNVDPTCENCECNCGIYQCTTGAEPVRVIHKRRVGKCGCDCTCSYKCLEFK